MTITLKSTVLATAIAVALLPVMAGAQNTATPSGAADQPAAAAGDSDTTSKKKADKAEEMGTVVVTGIRESLQAGLDVKRNADSFVDAINAEDVGKLPDKNIAEVLQRIPGVAIQRTRGEGDFITLRGLSPNFVLGQLDGRDIISGTETHDALRNGGVDTSTGRATNFDVLPSEIVSRVEVYKSPTASMTEGGIGGVVNIVTQDPLDLGTHAFVSANATYRDFNHTTDPDFSATGSWRNEAKTFGILANLSYSKRTIREDGMDTYGWSTPTNWAATKNIDSTGSGTPNLSNLSGAWVTFPRQNLETRERETAQVKADWKFADDSVLTANALYSYRTVDRSDLEALFGSSTAYLAYIGPSVVAPGKLGFSSVGNCSLATIGSLPFCTVPGATGSNGSITSLPMNNPIQTTDEQDNATDALRQFGLNYKKSFGRLSVDLDLSHSGSSGTILSSGAAMNQNYATPYTATNNGTYLDIVKTSNDDWSSGKYWYIANAWDNRRDDNQSATAFSAKGKLDFDDLRFMSSLEFGVRVADRDFVLSDGSRQGSTQFFADAGKYTMDGVPGTYALSNFGGGQFTLPFNQIYFTGFNNATARALAYSAADTFGPMLAGTNGFEVDERTTAFFVQDNFDTSLFDMPLKGNLGVRGVETRTDNTGYSRPFTTTTDPLTGLVHLVYSSDKVTTIKENNKYFDLLPTLNAQLEVRPDLLVRFAAGKSMTRPDFTSQLSPTINITNLENAIASAGNPFLKAYQSTNYDLGVEWYLAPSSALWAAAYEKDISNFIAPSTQFNTEYLGYTWKSLNRPENQGDAKVHGLEVGYQQVFENGFGYTVSGTLAGSSAKYAHGASAGQTLTFEGVSKKSANAAVFYEKAGWNARLAYSYRGSYLLIADDIFGLPEYNDKYGQFDAGVSYAYNDNVTFVVDAVNLTNQANRIYSLQSNFSTNYTLVGRRLGFGVRVKF